MSECRDCRRGCADGECDKPNEKELRILNVITSGIFIAMFLLIYFMVVTTRIQIGGINYTEVEHFETYTHCEDKT